MAQRIGHGLEVDVGVTRSWLVVSNHAIAAAHAGVH